MSGVNTRGFTLMELLVVAAIVALLGVVAYPGYQRHLVASRRVAATACLLGHAQAMERYYVIHKGYLDAPEPVSCQDVAEVYQFSFAQIPTAATYLLQAVPQGTQALHDAGCGALLLNQWGERMVSTDIEPGRCW